MCVSGRLEPFVEQAVANESVLTISAITVELYWTVRDPLKVIGIQMLIIKRAIPWYICMQRSLKGWIRLTKVNHNSNKVR